MNNVEFLRKLESYYEEVRNLKKYFIKNCLVNKTYEAYKIWAHWLIRNLCEVQDNYHIIPNQKIVNDSDIIVHLKEKGADPNSVHEFYNQIIVNVNYLYQKYHQLKIDCLTDSNKIKLISKQIKYTNNRQGHGQGQGLYHMYSFMDIHIKLNDFKHRKLLSRYKGSSENRNYYMFEVGFNYFILDGQSLQWCLPPKVFEILKTQLSVRTELFAAPINAVMPLYCSLFSVDKQFGALENFFNIDQQQVLEGTFEINPPFIDKIFIRSTEIVSTLLEKSQQCNKDLMFVYIMPNWLDSKGYQTLVKSKYLIDEIIFKENKHFYYQSSNDKMIAANFESHVMIIGTQKSKDRWTSTIKTDLINGFSSYEKKKVVDTPKAPEIIGDKEVSLKTDLANGLGDTPIAPEMIGDKGVSLKTDLANGLGDTPIAPEINGNKGVSLKK